MKDNKYIYHANQENKDNDNNSAKQEDTKKKKKDNNSETKKRQNILSIIILILLLILLLRGCFAYQNHDIPTDSRPGFGLDIDENATTEGPDKKTAEEIQDELNQMVEEGMINISMNTNPIFETGDGEGSLLIENREVNRHPQVVEIYITETNEKIYESKLIPVGNKINSAKLDTPLEKGEYACTAYFNSVDEETGALLGKAGAEIVISVLEDAAEN